VTLVLKYLIEQRVSNQKRGDTAQGKTAA